MQVGGTGNTVEIDETGEILSDFTILEREEVKLYNM